MEKVGAYENVRAQVAGGRRSLPLRCPPQFLLPQANVEGRWGRGGEGGCSPRIPRSRLVEGKLEAVPEPVCVVFLDSPTICY